MLTEIQKGFEIIRQRDHIDKRYRKIPSTKQEF